MFQKLYDQVISDIMFIKENRQMYSDISDFEWEYNRLGHTISIICIEGKLYKVSPFMDTKTINYIIKVLKPNSCNYIFNLTLNEDTVFGNLIMYLTNNGFSEEQAFRITYNYNDIISSVSDITQNTIFERICELYGH